MTTIERTTTRRNLSALAATALLASMLVIATPPSPAEAHEGGCLVATPHQHGNWWHRSSATTHPTIGRLVRWERNYQRAGAWNHTGTYRC